MVMLMIDRFIQMSGKTLTHFPSHQINRMKLTLEGMITGACLEADRRIRDYQVRIRMQKRIMRDRAAWERYEQEFDEPEPTQEKPT